MEVPWSGLIHEPRPDASQGRQAGAVIIPKSQSRSGWMATEAAGTPLGLIDAPQIPQVGGSLSCGTFVIIENGCPRAGANPPVSQNLPTRPIIHFRQGGGHQPTDSVCALDAVPVPFPPRMIGVPRNSF